MDAGSEVGASPADDEQRVVILTGGSGWAGLGMRMADLADWKKWVAGDGVECVWTWRAGGRLRVDDAG